MADKKTDSESLDNAPQALKTAVDTVKATNTLIIEIEKFVELLHFKTSVALEVFNFTNDQIIIKDTGHEFGGFKDRLPAPQIKPRTDVNTPGIDAFASGNDTILPEGTQGHVNYDISGNNFAIGWDIPFAASNKSNANVTGPKAKRFRVFTAIGQHGNNGVKSSYVIWQNDGPFSVKGLLPPGTAQIQNPHQQQPTSLKQILGI